MLKNILQVYDMADVDTNILYIKYIYTFYNMYAYILNEHAAAVTCGI